MAKGSCFTVGIEYIMCHPKKCLKVLMIPGDAMLCHFFSHTRARSAEVIHPRLHARCNAHKRGTLEDPIRPQKALMAAWPSFGSGSRPPHASHASAKGSGSKGWLRLRKGL